MPTTAPRACQRCHGMLTLAADTDVPSLACLQCGQRFYAPAPMLPCPTCGRPLPADTTGMDATWVRNHIRACGVRPPPSRDRKPCATAGCPHTVAASSSGRYRRCARCRPHRRAGQGA